MDKISMRIPDLPIPAVNCILTFRPYLRYIEQQIDETKSLVYKGFLQSIADILKSNPELLAPIEDMSVLDKYPELIELIKITHLSQVKADGMLYTLGVPSGKPPVINYFGYSEEFARFYQEKGQYLKLHSTIVGEEFRRNTYKEILRKAYAIDGLDTVPETMVQLMHDDDGVKHYYKVLRRHQFVDVSMNEQMPELRQEWVDYAFGAIADHTDVKEPLPFEKFMIEGFFIFSIIPDTEEVALEELSNTITQIHINNDADTFNKMKQATLSLLGSDDIEVGLLPFVKVNDKYVYHNAFTEVSLVFGRLKRHFSTRELNDIFNSIVNKSNNCSSIIASLNNDVYSTEDSCEEDNVKNVLHREGLNALKFIPVWHKDTLLGIIELGSSNPTAINVSVLRKLELAIPTYREFLMYKTAQFDEYMKSFIMQRYTAIQQSVAWKFNEQVWNAVKNATKGAAIINTPPVRFENLYPFYGAIDFRNSSQKQLEAIHSDFKAQLHYLEMMLQADDVDKNDKSIKDFLLQIRYWRNQLGNNIDIEEEVDLRHFLEIESVAFINMLAEQGKVDNKIATDYHKAVLTKDGEFHIFHSKYEESLQAMNAVLKEELYNAEVVLQDKVPHYFEKFQTDGLEYSLYAGDGINPSEVFPKDGINIIVNWQLDTILKMATVAAQIKPKLNVPLETTQLILVHENMVDISYRIDERHFDVEGSYSIRYEVVKKRIDKVKLLNSNERLTQPGMIAIVYAHKNGINPYIDKINELMASGALLPGIEYLDLEQLQGIGKLRAIRVKINTEHNADVEKVGNAFALND